MSHSTSATTSISKKISFPVGFSRKTKITKSVTMETSGKIFSDGTVDMKIHTWSHGVAGAHATGMLLIFDVERKEIWRIGPQMCGIAGKAEFWADHDRTCSFTHKIPPNVLPHMASISVLNSYKDESAFRDWIKEKIIDEIFEALHELFEGESEDEGSEDKLEVMTKSQYKDYAAVITADPSITPALAKTRAGIATTETLVQTETPSPLVSDVWIIGTNREDSGGYGIYRLVDSAWQAVQGAAVRIDVDSDGQPWVINEQGAIFQLTTERGWVRLPEAARDIGVGADDSVWIIGTNRKDSGGYGIYRLVDSAWQAVQGAAVRIAVAPNGQPWVINEQGAIFQLTTERGWVRLPEAARDIGVGLDGSVWIIGTNPAGGGYGIYRLTDSGWEAIQGGAVAIDVDSDGQPWVVNEQGMIFQLTSDRGWVRLPGAANDIGT